VRAYKAVLRKALRRAGLCVAGGRTECVRSHELSQRWRVPGKIAEVRVVRNSDQIRQLQDGSAALHRPPRRRVAACRDTGSRRAPGRQREI